MGEAITIFSREEAMAMPASERPLNFRLPSDIFHRIHEDIGAASMCWNPKPSKQIFDSERASKIAFDLCHFIADKLDEARGQEYQPPMEAKIRLTI